MSQPPSDLPERKPDAGVDISGGAVRARDIVGGDINIGGDQITGGTVTVQQGFSASQVQRLVITVALVVGGLVFATAAVFFVLGVFVSPIVLATLNRPLATPDGESSPASAAVMQQKIDEINSLPPGTQFATEFSETEVSSYFRFVLGPEMGISEGKVRFMEEPGKLAIGGKLDNFGGREVAGQLSLTTGEQPLVLDALWVKVLPTQGTTFGWVPVTPFAYGLREQFATRLTGAIEILRFQQRAPESPFTVAPRWLLIWAVKK